MNKTAIKNFAVWARQKLIEDITYKAGLLGVSDKGIAEALPQSTNDLKFFDIGTKDYAEVSGKEIKQRDALVSAIKAKERDTKDYKEAFEFIIEEVAYTWFNRLIAIRFMEVNDYLPSGIRVLSSENPAKNEPDFVTNPFEADLDLTPFEQDKVVELKDQNKSDELFRMLFIKQCNKLHEVLPRLFEKTDDYSELLLSISFTDNDGIIYHLTHDIAEDDFNVEKEGQIETIGWMYQYYNIEPKAAVFARAKGKKIKKEQVPAATQLFTPDWIVRYMVENSLGRLWHEGHSDSNIKDNWKYYLDEAEQEAEVQEKLNAIKEEYKLIKPEDIKLIDPCMGSGHILVYAFDVLMQIYENYGYTQRDAASLIVENNIYGLDIDERAAQLAYFAVMMKGRQYDRRFLTRNLTPHIYDIPDMEEVQADTMNALGDCSDIARRVCNSFRDGKEYGSLISPNVSLAEIDKLNEKLEKLESESTDIFGQLAINVVTPLMDIVKMLVQKYDVVVTNPPYMAVSNAGTKLNDYVKKNYPNSKADMFSVFMERGMDMLEKNRFQAMVTMQSWMFLSSFEKMRDRMIHKFTLTNLMHMENMVMGIAFGTAVSVFRNIHTLNFKGTYNHIKLSDIENTQPKEFPISKNRFAQISTELFSKIPGSPIAYWLSQDCFVMFNKCDLASISEARTGLATGRNDYYLRLWHEVVYDNIGINKTRTEAQNSLLKWFPYDKGGNFRKWFGNRNYVVNWLNDGYEMQKTLHPDGNRIWAHNFNLEYNFLEHISWSNITSGNISVRYFEKGFLFDSCASSVFFDDEFYIVVMAYLNSVITSYLSKVLNPTIHFNPGDYLNLPFDLDNDYKVIENLAKKNIVLSKEDWDSFENSWDFTAHPLIKNHVTSIENAYLLWKSECEDRFQQIRLNEEEINHNFLHIYGIQDELIPNVADKDVTIYRVFDEKKEIPESMGSSKYSLTKSDVIKSLISYSVGCMFGRYSLDVDGIAYAGGQWDDSKYDTFIPDEDNCIPVTDEEYFEDDIVGRFCDFIKRVFGEDSLEVNLKYIANALGNKGTTSRDVIRNYFLNDFIKDHIKIYQKRPIYWMFDSGKQNGFKALVYMHRWNADTIGNMRVEYLHRMQRVYDKEMERMQEIIDNSNDNKEVNAATKRKEKLQKQLKETKDYDAKIAHLALSRIDIDLDDGVKVNYEKVQTPPDGKKMQILTKL